MTALDSPRLTIFAGPPLHHAHVTVGPFVASTEAQARAFRARFVAGGMGRLTAFDWAALDRDFDKTRTGA
jgi:redox-sensitive bicupin YhaK (pirin superfamily)